MNVQHILAFVWLRWRLRVNQFKRGGAVNAAIFAVVSAGVAVAAVGAFFGGLSAGLFALPEAPPAGRLYAWDGIVAVFLFIWMIGLMTDLQRSDGVTLDKILHLPVSPAGAFAVNYVSSLASVTLLLFAPLLLGLAVGQLFAAGPALLLLFPLLASFLLAATALTYQFQGWLAALVSNPRRRRTVVVLVTFGFVLLVQIPNLFNLLFIKGHKAGSTPPQLFEKQAARQAELMKELEAGRLTQEEYNRRQQALADGYSEEIKATKRAEMAEIEGWVRVANVAIPPGWLPLGAAGLAEGRFAPALLGTLGFTLVGGWALWRAYRTTVRIYTGAVDTGGGATGPEAPTGVVSTRPRLVEWRLPGVSEPAAAVATAAFRGLVRAPEAKMALLAPIIMVVVFGSLALTIETAPPVVARPFIAFGAAALVLLTGIQLVGNQFGYDRAGFRAYVLSPVPRREVLLGKNLALAPLSVGSGLFALLLVECVLPLRFDHVPATAALVVSMFLLFCLLANLLSIYAPIPMAAGAMQPKAVKIGPVLLQMAFMMVFPVVLLPAVAPFGVEALLEEVGGIHGIPVALVGSLGVLAAVVFVYRRALTWEGQLLARREQAILTIVTSKVE